MYSTSELDELFQILNSIKGFKLNNHIGAKQQYVQKLRRRLTYAYKKASKYSDQQAQKYKFSYDKGIKGPQLQEKDLILVKVVAPDITVTLILDQLILICLNIQQTVSICTSSFCIGLDN